MNDISTEISFFKADIYTNNFELEISKDKDLMIQNYFPLPTNRKKKCKLSKMSKSSVLVDKRSFVENNSIDINTSNNKDKVKKLLANKNLN